VTKSTFSMFSFIYSSSARVLINLQYVPQCADLYRLVTEKYRVTPIRGSVVSASTRLGLGIALHGYW